MGEMLLIFIHKAYIKLFLQMEIFTSNENKRDYF